VVRSCATDGTTR